MTEKERQEILDWIRSEHAAGRALNIHAVKRRHPDLLKSVYEVRPFWGWWQAVTDAGLDYADLKIELQEKVACRLCGYEALQLNMHLRARHGMTEPEYSRQFPGAPTASEVRRARMRREGTKNLLPHWEPLYSDEYMMDRTYRYHRMGHRLRTTWVCEHDHNLWQHIHRQGITWESFVTGLGIPYTHELPPRPPRMSLEELLEGLRGVFREEGEMPTITQLGKRHHSLMTGVERHFGRYDEALEAAGLPRPARSAPPRREFSPDAVLEELRQLATEGHAITARGLKMLLERSDLHAAVEKMGGYPAIRKKLGIAKPALPGKKPYLTREEVIAAFQKQAAEGDAYTRKALLRGSAAERALLRSIRYHFKKWADLLAAANFVPEHHALIRARKRREELIRKVRIRYEAGEAMNRHAMEQLGGSKELYLNCRRTFGSWRNALAEAGIPVELAEDETPGMREIIAEILEIRQTGQPLDSLAMKSTPKGLDLFRRGKSVFKTWKNAVLAAGLEWPRRADLAWMKEHHPRVESARSTERAQRRAEHSEREKEVITAIRERQRNKKTLRLKRIRWETEGKELYDTARSVFGSWKAALKAAGCQPETPPPRKVSKIVKELNLAYPIDIYAKPEKSAPTSHEGDAEEKPKDKLPGAVIRGWRQSGKGEKQRTTPAKAKRRKKRK
jgi:hypothetical protein